MTTAIATRRGRPVYDANPSITTVGDQLGSKGVKIGHGDRFMLVDAGTGELVGQGHAAFVHEKTVDRATFVKMFLRGVQQTAKLGSAGLRVFEIIHQSMHDNPQNDRVELSAIAATRKHGLPLRTFQRGLKDLLDHEFIYCSDAADHYYLNINFMFNGNRVSLVESYRLAGNELRQVTAAER